MSRHARSYSQAESVPGGEVVPIRFSLQELVLLWSRTGDNVEQALHLCAHTHATVQGARATARWRACTR